MAGSKRYEIDMVNGPLARNILRFTLPLILSGALNMLFTAVGVMVAVGFVVLRSGDYT